jgi:hypothetical protein
VLRRIGLAAGLRVTVPPGEASEMIGMIRCVIASLIWGGTALGTLAIASTASWPAAAVVAVIMLELAGFVITLRRTRRKVGR